MGVLFCCRKEGDYLGAYKIGTEYQKIEEKAGVVQNTTEQRIEYMIMPEGKRPLKGGGKQLEPTQFAYFELEGKQVLWLRILSDMPDVPATLVTVNSALLLHNKDENPNVRDFLRIGLSVWNKESFYPADWCVIHGGSIYQCTTEHYSTDAFESDTDFWKCLDKGIVELTITDSGMLETRDVLGNEASAQITAYSAILDSQGNVISEYYASAEEMDAKLDTKSDIGHIHDARYYTEDEIDSKLDSKADVSSLSSVATSGSYNDLSDKPFIPSKVSQIENDSDYATRQEVASRIADIIANAPADLDTLKEIADYIEADKTNAANIATSISNLTKALEGKADSNTLATVATSGKYSDLSGTPSSLPASDVYAWAKAESKPSYSYSEVGAAASSHTHSQYLTEHQDISGKADKNTLSTVATSGSYNDLLNKPELNYLPLNGGALTGGVINRAINNGFINIIGGTEFNKGCQLVLFGKDYQSGDSSEPTGGFRFVTATVNDKYSYLIGTPNGTLTWNDNNLAGSAIVAQSLGRSGYVKYASGLIVQWIFGIDVANLRNKIALPISFSNATYTVTIQPYAWHSENSVGSYKLVDDYVAFDGFTLQDVSGVGWGANIFAIGF